MRWSRALRALGARLLDEVDSGGAPGHGETAWRRRRARLRRWCGDGGVGHGGGVRGGGAGEERRCTRGSWERGGAIHVVTWRGERRGGEQVRGARRGRRRAPACLPGRSSSLERCWAGPAGGLASGPAVAPGRVFPFFLFLFLFNISATLLN